MQGLTAGIYESKEIGNCSNGGISKHNKTVTIVGPGIPRIFDARPGAPAVKIVRRSFGGQSYIHAEPVNGKKADQVGWMAGGSFIYSCDSRFPSPYPIPLHDRQETAELNDLLSR